MKTVLFQGDSVTDASRSRDNDDYLGLGYPLLVASELGYTYPKQYRFLNRGVSGNRSIDVYARVKSDIINLKPDVISILMGINDVWHEIEYNNGICPEKFYTIYTMMIEEIKLALPETKIMILEPFVLKGLRTEARFDEFKSGTDKTAEKTRLVSQKYNLKFVPLQCVFDEALKLAPVEYWTFDGVHPRPAGHELIKREWIKAYNTL